MATPSVGGSAVPATLVSGAVYGGGQYKLLRQEERQAADGTPYRTGPQSVEWTWVGMGTTEYAWWTTQWLRGTAMAFELWLDDTRTTTQTFTSGQLMRPAHNYVEAGLYREVQIKITHLLPLLTI
jgi:hypothetical protein